MSYMIGIWLSAVPAAAATALSEAELLERAEASFRHGVELRESRPDQARACFRQAAEGYAELQQRGIQNAELSRNLGNAYFLAGDLPHAILAYRRGLQLAPLDSRLQDNLAFARQQVEYRATSDLGRQSPEQWPVWLPPVPRFSVSGLALTLYALGWLMLTRWRMTRRRRLLRLGTAALVAGAVALSVFFFADAGDEERSARPAVVIHQDGVLLRVGNGFDYPRRYDTPLNRGVEARLLYARNDWLQIELARGEIGWIPQSAAVVDEP